MPKKKKSNAGRKPDPTPTISVDEILRKEQQYYIKGNIEVLSPKQIALDLDLSEELVQEFINSTPKKTGVSRTSKMFQRPAKGVIATTEAASMAGDDIRNKGIITQAEINRAAAAGDYRLAEELTQKREQQNVDAALITKAKYGDRWHFIHDHNDLPPIDKNPARR